MKAYIFKLNGNVVDYDRIAPCLLYERDMGDLFVFGFLECEDCSSDNSNDIITVEELIISEDTIQ